ncbi:hypothetical protein LOTGIDRAFT_176014 [Lottia gigantea]|uniref:DUF5614 domain-containing protein n=1 Tax=Lottia gigantea TaxID=225164 RepID=V4BBB5_LOTGI|nr:hypothetical protein LOTGIDRAFT_176014 [Lottia gigantea]ESO86314.1 hypothetical protein LOTGIDRAFT_176014 [Lottia gigantea]
MATVFVVTEYFKKKINLKTKGGENAKSHLKSSNLSHYAGVIHAVQYLPDVIQVLQPFTSPNKSYSLLVDVVAGQGHMWVKVVARKAQALHLVWAGKGQFGERDLIEQADEYINCIEIHPINFLSPEIHFLFYNNVTNQMADELESKNIKVFGHRVDVEDDIKLKLKLNDFDKSCEEERKQLVMNEFLEICKNKTDFCESSEKNSRTHLPKDSAETCEKQTETLSELKAKKLQKCAETFTKNGLNIMKELLGVLPDLEGCSSTVGVSFCVYVHPARALTEMKEKTAQKSVDIF